VSYVIKKGCPTNNGAGGQRVEGILEAEKREW